MVTIRKHPELTDYFLENPATRAEASSIVEPYEAGKVIVFPQLKLDIDHDFWAALPSDEAKDLKKLRVRGEEGRIARQDLGWGLSEEVDRQTRALYEQLLPVYLKLFEPYRYVDKVGVLRLNRLVGLSMHIDSYAEAIPTHHARMFVNLDNQPRIWHTSYTAQEALEVSRSKFTRAEHETLSGVEWWKALRYRTFGGLDPTEFWDANPRHICLFEPGDVWVVDSRQVGHQVFYGRRALTIDFTVDPASMLNPRRHYLARVEDLRRGALAEDLTAEKAVA